MRQILVRDLMRRDSVTAGPLDSVATVRDLMYEHWVRHVPVVAPDGRLLGLVAHRDLLRRNLIEGEGLPVWVEQERLEHIRVHEVMKTLVETVTPETPIAEAGRVILKDKFSCLPVVADGRFVGILTESDFVGYVVESAEAAEQPVGAHPLD